MSSPIGILMILSPAKTIDTSSCQDRLKDKWTVPNCDEGKTKAIAEAMKLHSSKELEKLLGISSNLAKTSHEFWSKFDLGMTEQSDRKPCIFSFSGPAYIGLKIDNCTDDAVTYMQENLRILDPVYGVLRPLDLMQPYRLEMTTKLSLTNEGIIPLAKSWRNSISKYLSKDLSIRKTKLLLNLASDEYSAIVDLEELPIDTQYKKVVFLEAGRVVSVHSKRARGLMVRYIASHACTTLDDITNFREEGYKYLESKSDDKSIVFGREKQTPAPRSRLQKTQISPVDSDQATLKRKRGK